MTGLGHSVSAAVTGNRELESWEFAPLLTLGALLTAQAVLAVFKPGWLIWPFVVVMGWVGLSFLFEGSRLWLKRGKP